MKKLELNQLEMIEGGANGWNCAGAVLGTVGVTLAAGAITLATANTGILLAGWLVAKTAATLNVIGSCS